jgi:hypothetical protein
VAVHILQYRMLCFLNAAQQMVCSRGALERKKKMASTSWELGAQMERIDLSQIVPLFLCLREDHCKACAFSMCGLALAHDHIVACHLQQTRFGVCVCDCSHELHEESETTIYSLPNFSFFSLTWTFILPTAFFFLVLSST